MLRQSYFLFLIFCGITLSIPIHANIFSPIKEHIQKHFMIGFWNRHYGVGVAQRYPDFVNYMKNDQQFAFFKRALHSTDTQLQAEAKELYSSVLTGLKECLNNEQNLEKTLRTDKRNTFLFFGVLLSIGFTGDIALLGFHRIIKTLCFRGSIGASLCGYTLLAFCAAPYLGAWQFSFKKVADLREKIAGRPWLQKWCEFVESSMGYEQSIESLQAKIEAWTQLAPHSAERK